MVIFQPRLANISEFSISKSDLLAWAADTLVPAAKLAHAGEGEFCAGAHCQFCKIKATCRKRAEYNLELARYDFEMLNSEMLARRGWKITIRTSSMSYRPSNIWTQPSA